MQRRDRDQLYRALKTQRQALDPQHVATLFGLTDEQRVRRIAEELSSYIGVNLPNAVDQRKGLADYRTNPYVLLTSASILDLADPQPYADFLFNTKLYMALETSFGKSIESAMVGQYPVAAEHKWQDPPEKIEESRDLVGLSNEEKAKRRTASVWREIDKSCVVGQRRYVACIKSGPNCINDTQVQAMTQAIIDNRREWLARTVQTHPGANRLDVVIGLTYGTDRTTNNKENQILVKLLERGFVEESRETLPGVLVDAETRSVRVYRRVGKDFWAFVGNPEDPASAPFVFLEILLALSKALSLCKSRMAMEDRINLKIQALANALGSLRFPRNSLPQWVRQDFSESELFWFATALTGFYDEGI